MNFENFLNGVALAIWHNMRVRVVAVIDFAATLCSRPPAAPEKIGPYECCLENESYLFAFEYFSNSLHQMWQCRRCASWTHNRATYASELVMASN